MAEIPVTGAVAEYRGRRFRILFSGDYWVALLADPDDEVPDAFARGESGVGPAQKNRGRRCRGLRSMEWCKSASAEPSPDIPFR